MKKSSIDQYLFQELDTAYKRRSKYILENLNLQGKEKILDIGCGRGFYETAIVKLFTFREIIGIDQNEKYLKEARQNVRDQRVTFQAGDAQNLDFPDNTFDRVICSEVLEHLPNDNEALNQIKRVLKPGGLALITVPNKNYPLALDPINWFLERLFNIHVSSRIWWLAGIWADHVRLYSPQELRLKATKANLLIKDLRLSTRFSIPFSHFALYGVGKNLVEKGLCPSFNRFAPSKPSILHKILIALFSGYDKLNHSFQFTDDSPAVNILATLQK